MENEIIDESNESISNEPIYVSDQALTETYRLQVENSQWQDLDLRVFLSGKNCDGFVYGVCFDKHEDDDLVFLQPSDESGKTVSVIVDPRTYEFVRGACISWATEDDSAGFVVENPRHDHFKGKFYKRGFWRKRLEEVASS